MAPLQLDLLDWMAIRPARALPGDRQIVLHRVDHVRNMARFYCLEVARDLFGQWCLIRRYGRIGTRGGQVRLDAFPDEDAARQARDRLQSAKLRRGYTDRDR